MKFGSVGTEGSNPRRLTHKRKPPLPLRPLHHIWRRTIDRIELTGIDLPVQGLPRELRGLTACQISDFHLDRDEDVERLEQAVSLINSVRPDLVFLTGDYFSGPSSLHRYLNHFSRSLRDLRPAVATFAVAGNHDHWAAFGRVERGLRDAGVEVLCNENRRLTLRGASLAIVGIDDLWSRRADPVRAFHGLEPDECSLVLAHNPDTAIYMDGLRPGVMLSGHTHGGVVRLPYYGTPLNSFLRLGKQFYAGLNRYNHFFIYTNRGLGTFWLRVRINCRPEVSHFRLSSEAPANLKPRRLRLRKKYRHGSR